MHRKLLATLLSLALGGGSLALAIDTPGFQQSVNDASDKASRLTAAETAAAITALGANPSAKQIAAIVFTAVRQSPDSVLRVVDASVRVSPIPAVPQLVAAATAALPNRWKQVFYRRLSELDANKSAAAGIVGPQQPGVSVGLSSQVPSGPGTGDRGADSTIGIPMTLAEAIARTAFDAEPALSIAVVLDAVNAALLTDAATLLRYLESPTGASALGNAGTTSFSSEPRLTPGQPLVPPKQPVVSR